MANKAKPTPNAPANAPAPVTPIAGYQPQSEDNLRLVNANKITEETILRQLDALTAHPDYDKRWLAIARTHFEQGFMALNRSIMRPQRIKLEGDA